MQATFERNRFPGILIAAVLGIALALILGLGLGYALKASLVTTEPGRVVYVAASAPVPNESKCNWVNHQKEC